MCSAGAMRSSGVKDRAVYDAALRDPLKANPKLIGAWPGSEPNALDGRDSEFAGTESSVASGRLLPYWHRGRRETKRDVLVGCHTAADGAHHSPF